MREPRFKPAIRCWGKMPLLLGHSQLCRDTRDCLYLTLQHEFEFKIFNYSRYFARYECFSRGDSKRGNRARSRNFARYPKRSVWVPIGHELFFDESLMFSICRARRKEHPANKQTSIYILSYKTSGLEKRSAYTTHRLSFDRMSLSNMVDDTPSIPNYLSWKWMYLELKYV